MVSTVRIVVSEYPYHITHRGNRVWETSKILVLCPPNSANEFIADLIRHALLKL